MKKFAMVAAALTVGGCSSAWQRTMPEADAASTIVPGQARVTIQRTTNLMYAGGAANVAINEQRAGGLWRGESMTIDVPAGTTAVSVTTPTAPGRWTTRFQTVSGGRYHLELGVRGASYTSTLMLGYLGAALDAASNPEQGGSFQLAIVAADPPLGTAASSAVGGDRPVSGALTTAEGRREALEEARRLRREGLITDDVLRDQQRRILGQ